MVAVVATHSGPNVSRHLWLELKCWTTPRGWQPLEQTKRQKNKCACSGCAKVHSVDMLQQALSVR